MKIKDFDISDFHELEIARSKVDIFDFIQEYVKIEDRDAVGENGIVIPFNLWDCQREVLRKFLTDRLTQVLKANQLGLTWLILTYATWRLLFNPVRPQR